MPVPRPVIAPAGRPVRWAIRHADAVVLPMPMSPVAMTSYPARARSSATRIPVPTAAAASARVIAGPVERSAVPGRTLRAHTTRSSLTSVATPMSTTTTSAAASRASTLTAAPPARKFSTIAVVTSCGHGVTPLATTPWSAANTATAARCGYGGGQAPAIPASRTDTSSSTPSEPGGLVSDACRARAASIAAASSGRTAATVWSISCSGVVTGPLCRVSGALAAGAGSGSLLGLGSDP